MSDHDEYTPPPRGVYDKWPEVDAGRPLAKEQPDRRDRELCGKFELLPDLTKQQLAAHSRPSHAVKCRPLREKRADGKAKSLMMLDKLSDRADRQIQRSASRREARKARKGHGRVQSWQRSA